MAELRAIGNEIRALADPAVQRDRAVAGFAGAAWSALATAFWQMPIELQRTIFLAIDEAIDRLGADADGAHTIGKQTAGDLLRRPKCLQLLDDQFAQLRVAAELAQPSPTLLGNVVGDTAVIAAVFRKLGIMKGIALQFTIDRRSIPTELAGDLTDRNFAFNELMQTSAIGRVSCE